MIDLSCIPVTPDLSPSHHPQHLHHLQHRGPVNPNSPSVPIPIPTPISTSTGTLNRPDRLPSDEDKLPPKQRVLREQRDHQECQKWDVEDDTRMVVDGPWLLLF